MKTINDYIVEHSGGSSIDYNAMIAEINRLREALELIAKKCECCDYGYKEFPCTCFDRPFADEIALAALEGK